MSALLWYGAGLVTMPAIYFAPFCFWKLTDFVKDRLGWSMAVKTSRDPEGIEDHTLRNNIWFERQRGPIFTGHWCRDTLKHKDGEGVQRLPVVTRWWGLGKADGRSIMLYHKRSL